MARLAGLEEAVDQDRARAAESEARLSELTSREHEVESAARVSEVSVEAAARELDQIAERTRAQAAEVESLKDQAEALAAEREALLRQRDELQSLGSSDEGRLFEAEAALREAGRDAGHAAGRRRPRPRGGRRGAVGGHLAPEPARPRRAAARRPARPDRAEPGRGRRAGPPGRPARRRPLAPRREAGPDPAAEAPARRAARRAGGAARAHPRRVHPERGEAHHPARGAGREALPPPQPPRDCPQLRGLRPRRAEPHDPRRPGRGTRDRGVFGLVADVVSAPAEYEDAIEAVLGERLQYVIVESHSQGVEAIDYLKTAAEGRASLIPMARLRAAEGASSGEPDRGHPGFVAGCLDVVRFDPVLREGRPLPARRRGDRPRPPLRAGDLAAERAEADAGDAGRRGARPVRRRDRRAARGRGARGAAAAPRGAGARGDGPRASRRSSRWRRSGTAPCRRACCSSRRRSSRSTRTAARRSWRSSRRRRTSPASARSSSGWPTGPACSRRSGRSSRTRWRRWRARRRSTGWPPPRPTRSRGAPRSAPARRWPRSSRPAPRGDVLTAELMNLKVKVAADAERREGIGAALKRIEDARREVDERRARLFAALSEANARASELRGRLDGTRIDLGPARAGPRGGARGAVGRPRRARGASWPRRARARPRRASCAAAPRRCGRPTARRPSPRARTRWRSSHLEEQTRERCQAELRWEVARFHLERPPGEAEREKLEELKAQAERMGAINLTAIEEYDELSQRHDLHERAEGRPRAVAGRPEVRDRRRSTGPRASASRRPSTA